MPLEIDPDIRTASTLPSSFYKDQSYWEQCREKIFARSWQFAGDTDQISVDGSAAPLQLLQPLLDEPLLLTRDQNGKVHCLSNVCTHRGNLMIEKACKVNDLRCKYHGRRFGLDGSFTSMPEFREVANFPTAADNLAQLPLHQWGKLLFTSLEKAKPAGDFFNTMASRTSWMPHEKLTFRADLSRDYTVEAHWALYVENYLEGFHIPFVHAGLNALIDYHQYEVELFPHASLQIGIAKEGDICFDLPATSPDHGKKVAGYYFWVFPNMMFNFYPWGLSINLVNPIHASRTQVRFLSYVWDETKLSKGAGGDLHKVELEDEDVVQNVQKGIRSRFYNTGRYSVTRETGTHHFHRLVASFLSR